MKIFFGLIIPGTIISAILSLVVMGMVLPPNKRGGITWFDVVIVAFLLAFTIGLGGTGTGALTSNIADHRTAPYPGHIIFWAGCLAAGMVVIAAYTILVGFVIHAFLPTFDDLKIYVGLTMGVVAFISYMRGMYLMFKWYMRTDRSVER